MIKARAGMAKEEIADWSMGESFGWGSLLMDGHHVRVSGQENAPILLGKSDLQFTISDLFIK